MVAHSSVVLPEPGLDRPQRAQSGGPGAIVQHAGGRIGGDVRRSGMPVLMLMLASRVAVGVGVAAANYTHDAFP